MKRPFLDLFLTFGVCGWAALGQTAVASPTGGLHLVVLSSAALRVTGGDALIEVVGEASGVEVRVNGADATSSFAKDPASGRLRGLVAGLKLGANTVTAKAGAAQTSLTVTNYPLAGPVFSGPHQTPFVCETQSFKLPDGKTLGEARDADCFAPTNVQYLYMPTGSEQLKPLDPSGPRPSDLARTKTSKGADVPYIVRLETGVINRAIYQNAMLAEPGAPLPTPTTTKPGWNQVLVYALGGGCGVAFRQGRGTGGVINGGEMNNDPLTMGYAVASASLNVLGQNCNDVTSAETAMMVKEHFIKEFGPPVHTIGLGGSGGSMQQNLFTENYPGILDGIMPQRSFPDTHTMLISAADCPLFGNYFDGASLSWSEEQKASVMGFPTSAHCAKAWANYLPRWVSPLGAGCAPIGAITRDASGALVIDNKGLIFDPSLYYDPVKNPNGVRCGYYDNAYNIFGKNPDGSARRPLDNVGVQYGLKPFNDGKISFEQFVDLNRKIGGFDSDAKIVPQRMEGSLEAIKIAYATGRMNGGTGLSAVPIIDVRTYTDSSPNFADVHMAYTTEVARARWKAANGSAANFVAWRVPTSPDSPISDLSKSNSPSRQTMRTALAAMDRWLDAIDADTSALPRAQKIVKDKPQDLVDACYTAEMKRVSMHPDNPKDECMTMYPDHSDPRIVAGDSLLRMTLKCTLQPVTPKIYQLKLSADQLAELKAVFPQGVCDYSKPGIGRLPLAGQWLSYPKPGTFEVPFK
jgi:hypothetical protein